MSPTRFTPGPWTLRERGDWIEVIADGRPVAISAVVDRSDPSTVSLGFADARLIAAAPDLLAALRAIAESSGRYDDPEHDAEPIEHALVMRDIALGAIAKAEGGE